MTVRYLLDTNVVSLLLRADGDRAAQALVQGLPQEVVYLSAITIGEIQRGISRLPTGRKRDELAAWFLTLQGTYADAILPITRDTALRWGELTARMQAAGQNIKAPDLLIAATALEHDLTVVTRNVRDCAPTGASVLDPWNSPAEPAAATSPTP
ncbi:MAG: type II toxin-antitoxin system VapC family toxin [Thermomicrobiales bacterium]